MPTLLGRLRSRFERHPLTVWHSPHYRLPIASLESTSGMEPRRADYVAWYLVDRRVVPEKQFRRPSPASYADIARVHSNEYIESLSQRATISRIFACSPEEISVDSIMNSIRLACGATLDAARETLTTHVPALNLLGGFHHAGKTHGGGFCALNDMAIALASLRAGGFQGRLCVIDLDAHQPDGTAECLVDDPNYWIGSLSGSSWGDLPNVDETILPTGTTDDAYVHALEKLLGRMPKPDLAFVVAGGDVLAGDRLGGLALTLDGTRRRDLACAEAIHGVPSVWLPAGGYGEKAWKVLSGTAIALTRHTRAPMRAGYDPMRARFKFISTHLEDRDLTDGDAEDNDIAAALGLKHRGPRLLLGYYTAQGMEYVFSRYGVLDHLSRLGYSHPRLVIDESGEGDRLRLFGQAAGTEYLLIETVLEKKRLDAGDVLYVHWLTLRHPLAKFDGQRPGLPGQEVPGLGLAKESVELFSRMAARLGLQGVAFRPAAFHTAYSARTRMKFNDPDRQARFQSMIRDLANLSLHDATTAVAEGRVRLNGEPYSWEPDLMISWLKPKEHPPAPPPDVPAYRFTIV